MSVFALKILAILAMSLDHIAAVFLSPINMPYLLMRGFGRIAFPIFCFLIVEGYYHTRDVKKYMIRLAGFALVSEIPFDLCFYQKPFYWQHQNVFFTLALGLITIYAIDEIKKRFSTSYIKALVLQFAVIILAMTTAWFLSTDYSMLGILIIIAFYVGRGNIIQIAISICIVTLYLGNTFQLYSLLALIPIYLYNGKKGPSMRYVFYVFYPAHMLILYVMSSLI
ncbi:TraX protein [Anaerosporobacter mobilis DSM 15930]|uniref:TraX protein n=1 Tax=Anaerosporobacter mobilis DSM 15930 TaxID=1120996 RepID=A0A1M7F3L9_9FIRM|nr:TraX family protein [Anaerosporobacter mobilis]SHL98664.1 TraX protein [Anaerosporobacter mobilis DSM 15930]